MRIPKTGRRTKAAQRTPATGHGERAQADAPFGNAVADFPSEKTGVS